jgi:DNA-binding PadR family transcriptional regulator
MFGKFRHLKHAHRFAHGPFGRHGLFGRPGGGRGGHRGFGGRRLFEQGDLRFVILHQLQEKPRHGYEIIKALEDRFGGMYSPSPGVIYPTLTLLEELGYARVSAEEGGKKLYTITADGIAFLQQNQSTVDEVMNRVNEASRAYGGGPAPEVRRAAHNLQMALSLRLGKGPLSDEQSRRIASILDHAASDIERS